MMNDRRLFAWILCLLASVTAGCSDSDGIRQYVVEKEKPKETSPAVTHSPAETPAGLKVGWFFKLTGPNEDVLKQLESFGQLVRSVRFGSDGQPTWTLPAAWSDRHDQGMRFATITIPGEPPLTATVIPLPTEDPASPAYLKSNLNRWRTQLGLPERDGDDWLDVSKAAGEVAQTESNGRTVTIVNLTGTTKDFGESRMLAALVPSDGSAATTIARQSASPPTPPNRNLPLTYTLPEAWKEVPTGQFQLASFTVDHGGLPAKISVSQVGGDLLANINRWRTQVGLPGVDEMANDAEGKAVAIGGLEGKVFHLEGETDAILGAVVPQGDRSWFFKAQGSKAAIAQLSGEFDAFLKSVQFRN